jgi:hypothetical protein
MVRGMGVALEQRGMEVDLAQVAAGVARGLFVEVRRVEMAALAAGGDGHRSHALAELDDSDEAVAVRAVHPLRPRVGPRAERGERALL